MEKIRYRIDILLQIGVWFTPILWNVDALAMPDWFKVLVKLNPMYYVVNGYRNALINKHWFWETPRQMLYFWLVALFILGVGMLVFKRLKPHFADVL